MQEFLDLFQRDWRQLEKQVFLCCFTSFFFANPVDVHCIFNNIYHFRPFRSLSCYPRVTLLIPDHHKNFECLTSQGLSLTFGLFQDYSLGYSSLIASEENQRKSWFEFFISYYLIVVFWYLLVMNFLCWFIDEWRMI